MKILFIFLFTLLLHAGEPNQQIWSMGQNHYIFFVDQESKTLISKSCVDKKKDCMALKEKSLPRHMVFSKDQLSGGKNPASLICSIAHHGEVLVLKDLKGNENSFCLFKDNTIIDAHNLE